MSIFENKTVKIPPELKKVNEIFENAGFKVFLVGGAVRDMLRNKTVHDFDLATNASPQQVMKLFKRVIPTGIAHGTVTIHIFGLELETTTFRTESSYSDGRHPDNVKFTGSIEEDLSRRDFTMNAIAANLTDGTIIDPFDGKSDIKNKIIRTVGNPFDRFNEDGLRPVRAIRFASQLGFKIEENTFLALKNENILEKVKKVSVERFREEFCKILQCKKPSLGLKLLEESKILSVFIPEFDVCRGCLQQDDRGFHEFDVADHLFYACDGAPKDNLIVRLAAFYHDIGKPEARSTEIVNGKQRIHFHKHEIYSAEKCKTSMTKLKFSNNEIEKVVHLVREHMFFYESSWSDASVRRFIIRTGTENIENLMLLRLADIYGMHNCPIVEGSATWNNLLELKNRIINEENKKNAFSLKNMALNGKDLIEIGIPKGKIIGQILNELFETITDSPSMNEKEKLLVLAKNIYEQKYKVLK